MLRLIGGGANDFARNNSESKNKNSSEVGSRTDFNIKKGMPLGNLTSQFFANVYLNELDYFVKHKLKAKYYIRYVDDFVILHPSKSQLEIWKKQIEEFLKKELKLELGYIKIERSQKTISDLLNENDIVLNCYFTVPNKKIKA